MTTLSQWFKKMIEAIVPSPKSNAWDQYKKYRQLETEALSSHDKDEIFNPRQAFYLREHSKN